MVRPSGNVAGIVFGWFAFLLLAIALACPVILWAIFGSSFSAPAEPARFIESPVLDQWLAVITFVGIKFIYTILCVALIALLWRRNEPDLAGIRWALLAFFWGELGCYINVLGFHRQSVLFEHLHSVGMVLCFGLSIYALFEGLDHRVIHYSDEARCGLASLCRGCIKHMTGSGGVCGLRRMFMLLIGVAGVMAVIPLCVSFDTTDQQTRIFRMLQPYGHPLIQQWYELRYLPVAALVLLGTALFGLILIERHPTPASKILFCAAGGAIGFSWFRMVLVKAFADKLAWFDAWEEVTELLFVAAIAGVLLVFASGLGLFKRTSVPDPEETPA